MRGLTLLGNGGIGVQLLGTGDKNEHIRLERLSFNGQPAIVRTATATQITATVPIGATTGPLTVTTAQGVASIGFTVTATGDFVLTAAPAPPATARVIAGDQTAVAISAGGTGSFTSLVALEVSAGPTGIDPAFQSIYVAPGGSTFLTFAVGASVPPGVYGFTVTGRAQVDGQEVIRTAAVNVEVLAAETPAVTGRILTAESIPQPIPGVTVTLGTAFTLTDAAGNFVLLSPPSGANMLFVDGRTASTPEAQYPIVEVNLDVAPAGPTRVPFPIYLPILDTANAITLPLDTNGFTTQEVKATTPRIPGLEVTIPQGTRIIDGNGNPVGQLVITPVPVDRSPMPFPAGVNAPLLFAINPGGAVPSQPLPISFPNVPEAAPGGTADLYYFDLGIGDWNTWGTGTVSADAMQVVSNPGYGLPRLAWHFFDRVRDWPRRLWKQATAGDPVDLATGVFSLEKTDLMLPGRVAIAIQRTYRSDDTRTGFFGIGWNLGGYDSRLTSVGGTLNLTTAAQDVIQLRPTGPGQWGSSDPMLQGAVVTALPGEFNWQIRYKDGTVHRYDRIVGFANTAGLAAVTDRHGNTVTLTRESPGPGQFGLITRITEPTGRFLTLTYDAASRITTVTDPLNRTVTYTYDAQGRLHTVTDAAGGVTTYTYDTAHRLLTITDPRAITYLTNEYDGAGRVIRQTQADSGVWEFAYTVTAGNLSETRVTDPRGQVTTHRFNGVGLLLSTTDALGQTTVYEYAEGSNLLRATTDPLGRTTALTYDAAGNVTSVTRLAGTAEAVTTSFTYEPVFNRLRTVTDPLNHVTEFQYDAQGNLQTIIDPRNKPTTLTYNSVGQPLTVTDPLQQTTTFEYDAHGNLAAVVDPLGRRTERVYDAGSRLLRQVNALGRATVFAYDALNQMTAIADALGGVTRFSYDGNGNLLTLTDARGSVTAYAYDPMDRVQTRTDPLTLQESYAYDGNDNVTQTTDRKSQATTSTYDPLNRLADVVYDDGAKVRYTYDAVGRPVEITDSVGGTITRSYDRLDRLTQEITPQGTVSYTYDAAGRRTGMTVSGQPPVSYTYDEASRLTTVAQGTAVVTLEYDDANRRTQLTLPNGVRTGYAYDAASQLTSLTYTHGGNQLGTLTYGYDGTGQRTQVGGTSARTLLPGAVPGATYNAANHQLTFGDQTLTYDLNGNLTADNESTYTWNTRNQLVAVVGPTPASFLYDALGRRQRKTVAATMTDFIYDLLNPVQEATGAAVVDLLTGLGIDEYWLRTVEDGPAEHYMTDALGSTLALTDLDGGISTEYSYAPFGVASVIGAPSSNAFSYTGREDDGTGLYHYRARYYHPTLQRFISEDPIEFTGGDTSLYAYVRNAPADFVDPTGEVPLVLVLTVAGAGFGAVEQALVGYNQGARGWDLAGRAAIGAAAGAAGAFSGVVAGAITRNPVYTGAVANSVYGGVLALVEGRVTIEGVVSDAIIGGAAGGVAVRLTPFMGGPRPNMFSWRSTYGRNSKIVIRQGVMGAYLATLGGLGKGMLSPGRAEGGELGEHVTLSRRK